jgi:hypothetical protein
VSSRNDSDTNANPQRHSVKKSEKYDTDSSYKDDDNDSIADSFIEELTWGVLKLGYYAVATPGVYSWERVTQPAYPSEGQSATPRVLGERVIPFVRVDVSYSRIASDIYAFSEHAEIGYGPFGFQARAAQYRETDPDASLNIKQHHWLYRMSLGDKVELDLGLGGYELSGVSTNSGGSSMIRLLIYPTERFGIELHPSWATINGNSISDHEMALTYGDRYWSALVGYHWLEGPGSSLNGSFVGFSLRL